jgi:cytidylate kinase
VARSYSSLPPGVEQRLAGWTRIQEGLAKQPEPRIRPTITISRAFGCDGFPLAERLKGLMDHASSELWNIYDKSLIEKVAEDERISLTLLQNLGDMSRAIEAYGLLPKHYITHDEAFNKVAKYITQIAGVGNAIIVGRGGAILCQGMKNCFHFRLEASFEWRVASMAKRLDISVHESEKLVKSNSKAREQFLRECLGAKDGDIANYDAIFNNEHHSVDDIAAAILAYVKQAWEDKRYFKS